VCLAFTAALWLAGLPGLVSAGPINTNAAIAPGEGATMLRLQYSYAESGGQGNIAHINASTFRATLVHGFRRDLALFLSVPLIDKRVDMVTPNVGRTERVHDGVGDATLMAKYRFWYEDPAPGTTKRLAAIIGINIRSGDSDVSGDSYNPRLGAAYSWRAGRGKFDADIIYQINTGRGDARHDALGYDAAYSFRVAPVEFGRDATSEFDMVAELNGVYRTDGSHTLYISPGFQFITADWIFETSLQLPVVQDGEAPETDYRVSMGLRFQW